MKEDIYTQREKVKLGEIKRFSQALDKLGTDIEELNQRIRTLEQAIYMIKDKERRIEQ